MPLNTSDFHKTICLEMRMANAMNVLSLCHGPNKSGNFVTPSEKVGLNKFTFPSIDASVRTIPTANNRNSSIRSRQSNSSTAVNSNVPHYTKEGVSASGNITSNQNYNFYNSNNADLASVDSSDTFMSCQTHPFISQTDLAVADDDENICNLDMLDTENLYINAMSKNSSGTLTRGSSLYSGGINIVDSNFERKGQVKKSTSGDTALRSLGDSPVDDLYTGSHVSLNETPLPKHRKTRFQQQQIDNYNHKPKTRFNDIKDSIENIDVPVVSTVSNKKNRRASFMPTKIIKTATKQLINQHLFGIQTKGSIKIFSIIADFDIKILLSVSEESQDTHKRSKSILKNKSDARLGSDPESERLLSDTGSGVSDISVIPVSLFKLIFKRTNINLS